MNHRLNPSFKSKAMGFSSCKVITIKLPFSAIKKFLGCILHLTSFSRASPPKKNPELMAMMMRLLGKPIVFIDLTPRGPINNTHFKSVKQANEFLRQRTSQNPISIGLPMCWTHAPLKTDLRPSTLVSEATRHPLWRDSVQ